MDRQKLRTLLTVNQTNDYTWMAILSEMTPMWAEGHSEAEARDNWLKQYDNESFYPMFDSIAQEGAAKRRHEELTATTYRITEVDTAAEEEHQRRIERPTTIDFPFRGKLYRIATNEGLPKRHIILPSGTVLVVCRWTGRVPASLADVRRNSEPMAPEEIVAKLDGVLAEEIPLQPRQITKAMAIFDDMDGQRYTIDYDSDALVEFPDGRLCRITSTYPGEPVRIATMIPFDANDSYMPYQLERFGKTSAIPVDAEYPGMAHEPRDLRIHFSVQGEAFILSHEAYEQHKWIVYVPDHGYYQIECYLESSPVQLGELKFLAPNEPINSDGVAVALRLADAVDVLTRQS